MQEGSLGFACDGCCDHDPDHGWCCAVTAPDALARVVQQAEREEVENNNIHFRQTSEIGTLRRQVDDLRRVRKCDAGEPE
jgi:hypothetical protein